MDILVKSKKSIISFGIFMAFIIIGVGISLYLHAPNNMIALDINPSIEIHTNRLGQVVSVDSINEDAKQLLAGYQISDKNLENVIGDIVDRLLFNGYLTSENTNEILISADASDGLLSRANAAINDYLQEKQLNVEVLQQTLESDNENKKTAHEKDISVGKMAIINKILENSDNVTVDELADYSIKDLMKCFKELKVTEKELAEKYAVISSKQELLADTQSLLADDQTFGETDEQGAFDEASGIKVTPVSEEENDSKNSDNEDGTIEDEKDSNKDKYSNKVRIYVNSDTKKDSHSEKYPNNSNVKVDKNKAKVENNQRNEDYDDDDDANKIEDQEKSDNDEDSKYDEDADDEDSDDEDSDDEDSDDEDSDDEEDSEYEEDDDSDSDSEEEDSND